MAPSRSASMPSRICSLRRRRAQLSAQAARTIHVPVRLSPRGFASSRPRVLASAPEPLPCVRVRACACLCALVRACAHLCVLVRACAR
eukprot:7763048-Alexandrium_andersonii.AAC.1